MVRLDFRWPAGQLQAILADVPSGEAPTGFAEIGPDEFVALTGTERGERLLVVRGRGMSRSRSGSSTGRPTRSRGRRSGSAALPDPPVIRRSGTGRL